MQALVITGMPSDVYYPCGIRLAIYPDGMSESEIIEDAMDDLEIDHNFAEMSCEWLQDHLAADHGSSVTVYIEDHLGVFSPSKDDDAGCDEPQFRMSYRCSGGGYDGEPHEETSWTMDHSSHCNDKCPVCNREMEPEDIEDIEPEDDGYSRGSEQLHDAVVRRGRS